MNRTPPEAVQRSLRKEVNFGCPIPGCGNPLLTWHHFDPAWRKRPHFDTNGMIALCLEHHKMADQGLFDQNQLRHAKENPNPLDVIIKKYDWMAQEFVLQLGTNAFRGRFEWPNFIFPHHSDGPSVLAIERDENGLALFTAILQKDDGTVIGGVIQNNLIVDTTLAFDVKLSVSAHAITIWHDPLSIGVKLRYDRLCASDILDLLRRYAKRDGNEAVSLITDDLLETIRTIPDEDSFSSWVDDSYLPRGPAYQLRQAIELEVMHGSVPVIHVERARMNRIFPGVPSLTLSVKDGFVIFGKNGDYESGPKMTGSFVRVRSSQP